MKQILADSRLYGIVDMGYTTPEQILPRTEALIAGGVRVIQLRAKGVELPLVRSLAWICKQFAGNKVPFLC